MPRTKKASGQMAEPNSHCFNKKTMKGGSEGGLLSRLGSKLAYGLGRIGRTFKSVEGKFQYNTRQSNIASNRYNNTKKQNQTSESNKSSPFKVYFINKLNRNYTVLNAISPNIEPDKTINTLPELIHVNASFKQNSVFDKYYQKGYLGYLYKGIANKNNKENTLFMLYKGDNNVLYDQHELGNNYGMQNLLSRYKKLRILVVVDPTKINIQAPKVISNIRHEQFNQLNQRYVPNVQRVITALTGGKSNNAAKIRLAKIQRNTPDKIIYPINIPVYSLSFPIVTNNLLNNDISIYVKLLDLDKSYGFVVNKNNQLMFIPLLNQPTDTNTQITWSTKGIYDDSSLIGNRIYGYSESRNDNRYPNIELYKYKIIAAKIHKWIYMCMQQKLSHEDKLIKTIAEKYKSFDVIPISQLTNTTLPFMYLNAMNNENITPSSILENIQFCKGMGSTVNIPNNLKDNNYNMVNIIDIIDKELALLVNKNDELIIVIPNLDNTFTDILLSEHLKNQATKNNHIKYIIIGKPL